MNGRMLSLLVVVAALTCYHLAQRSMPEGLRPAPMFAFVYAAAALVMVGVVTFGGSGADVRDIAGSATHWPVWVLIGSALVKREDGKAANRLILVQPDGAVAATYDKLHMFDVDLPTGETARESATYEPGDRAVIADVDGTRLGLTICYDLRFPALYRALALAGAEVMTIPAAFTRPTGAAHWEVLMRARAIETGSYVIAPAQGGRHEDGRGTWGRTLAVGPWGEVLGALEHDEPGVLFADLDLGAVAKARAAIPALANARAFTGP